jgi:hypothetical protein
MKFTLRITLLTFLTFIVTSCSKALVITTAAILFAPEIILMTYASFETRTIEVTGYPSTNYLSNREYQLQKDVWMYPSNEEYLLTNMDPLPEYHLNSLSKRNLTAVKIPKGTCLFVNTILATGNLYSNNYDKLEIYAWLRDGDDVQHCHVNVNALFDKQFSSTRKHYAPNPAFLRETIKPSDR